MDALAQAPLGALIMVHELLSHAVLMGSRGRARHYGRPDPEDADWDWIIFTDDLSERAKWHWWMHQLAKYRGFKLRPRDDGTLTVSGCGMDISTHPLWKIEWIEKVWKLQERGASKEQSYATAMYAMYREDREFIQELDQLKLLDVVITQGGCRCSAP